LSDLAIDEGTGRPAIDSSDDTSLSAFGSDIEFVGGFCNSEVLVRPM
jgi:hypothetical protein